jgi:hypothetical protein
VLQDLMARHQISLAGVVQRVCDSGYLPGDGACCQQLRACVEGGDACEAVLEACRQEIELLDQHGLPELAQAHAHFCR